jgi:hypothetical protein
MGSQAPVAAFVPIEQHPQWGQNLRFAENVFSPEAASSLVEHCFAYENWQEQSVLGRRTVSFARDDRRDVISYYDSRLEPASSWPLVPLSQLFTRADQLLCEWLPESFTGVRSPNYLLFNQYPSALSNARWHQDVPEAIEDWILSLTFGGSRLFMLQPLPVRSAPETPLPVYYSYLPHNSALLMGPGINGAHLHCIPPCTADDEIEAAAAPLLPPNPFHGPRLNLTFRAVLEF